MSDHPTGLCSDPTCPSCAQARTTAAFRGEPTHEQQGGPAMPREVQCPKCRHRFAPEQPVRVTETTAITEATTSAAKASGDVEYADPGFQKDGKARYPLSSAKKVKAAWSYINDPDNAKPYKAKQLQQIKAKIKRAAKQFGIEISDKAAEAWISGTLSFSDMQERVRAAIRAKVSTEAEDAFYRWVWIADMSAAEVVYSVEYGADCDLFQCTYSISADGSTVELGDPVEVVRTYAPAPADSDEGGDGDITQGVIIAAAETRDGKAERTAESVIRGRVLESKGEDEQGNRIFGIQVIAYGDSKNRRRYPETVMRAAAPMYEGAKIYDHHRNDDELRSGTIAGLVGYCRNVQAGTEGIEADAVMLPSAVHAVEALEAALAAQADGLDPMVGFSHDTLALFTSVTDGALQLQEVASIEKVLSVDLVSDPAAGGKATRVVAGGINPNDPAGTVPVGESTKETDVAPTKADVLAALQGATAEELAAVGLSKANTTETTTTETEATKATEAAALAQEKGSFLGRMLIRSKIQDAFPATAVEKMVESVTTALPDRITEGTVDAHIAALKAAMATFERADLTPRGTAQVTQESMQKKVDALDAFFAQDFSKGYRSFREAFIDFTGQQPNWMGEDFNRTILAETFGDGYSAGRRARETRTSESLVASSWALALGDSITRRLIADYSQPSLQNWRAVVSSTPPVNDFRTQRIERLGGYGTLPVVNEGQPYQPLTSPTGEEVTYLINKKGGTEDITLEMIANDDIRVISKIPSKLGLAAAQTLYRFVWDMFVANAATTYDATALFHATHGNTDVNTLSQSNLSVGRGKMRQQKAYGDSANVLSVVPKTLIVPSSLEELAFQLATSAVAIPATPAGPSNTPNLHQGLEPIIIDYWTSQTQWYLGADTSMCPTIEVGFYQGRQEPELFTQADQTVGSMYDADKMTFKIRHIYSGAVLEHRGLYRGNA
ncbi:DUF6582 domain-containing protein [Amycolatopsis sp. cmx-4-68]|uniref:phage major capsid protein n=1 Tax=Amycolatopsis sp. cmx-4-68 TaxID=2790938 RepID=UPI00397C6CED